MNTKKGLRSEAKRALNNITRHSNDLKLLVSEIVPEKQRAGIMSNIEEAERTLLSSAGSILAYISKSDLAEGSGK